MAWRLHYYDGVMRVRVRELLDGIGDDTGVTPQQDLYMPSVTPGAEQVDGTREALTADPTFAGLFSFGTSSPAAADDVGPDP